MMDCGDFMRRFSEYAPRRFRSGKYAAFELREAVAAHQISRVVDLRDREPLLSERTYASIGVELVRVSVDETRPLPRGLVEIVDVPGTLVHCWKGSHRTGAVVATMRMRDGWEPSCVWEEMQAFGFGAWDDHAALAEGVFGAWRPC